MQCTSSQVLNEIGMIGLHGQLRAGLSCINLQLNILLTFALLTIIPNALTFGLYNLTIMIRLSTKFWLLAALTLLVVCATNGFDSGYTIPPSPVPLPVDESADIFGKYTVTRLGSNSFSGKIDFEISKNELRFKGCNTNWGTLTYDSKTKIFKVSGFFSTLIGCPDDQDYLISQAITSAKRVYKRSNGDIIFENAQGFETLRLGPKVDVPVVTPPQPVSGSPLTPGKYTLVSAKSFVADKNVQFEISQTEIRFRGCNTNWATYTYDSKSRSFNVGTFANTLIYCQNDQDGLIQKALNSAVRAYTIKNFVVFQDGQWFEVLRLAIRQEPVVPPYVPPTVPVDQSADIFKKWTILKVGGVNLNKLVSLEISSNEIRFKGCNQNWASFSYDSASKTFTVGPFASTRIGCADDSDASIVGAIQAASRVYRRSNGLIIFENSQGVETLRLGAFVGTDPVPPYVPPTIPPTVPADESADIFGSFVITRLGSSKIDRVILEIKQDSISFRGCNQNRATFSYDSSSKTFKVGQFIKTLIYCTVDQDGAITAAILESVRVYRRRSGAVIFQDASGNERLRLETDTNVVVPPTPPVYPTDPVPPVVLPGVTFVSLKGSYFLKSSSSSLPTLVISLDDGFIQFEGCNVQRIPYAAYTDGVFCLLSGGSSTRRTCPIDNDQNYISLLSQSSRFVKVSNGYQLLDQNNNLIATLENKVRNEIVLYKVINGGYQLEVQGIDAEVSHSTISFSGCNSVSIPYRLNGKDILFGSATTTLVYCDQDTDGIYVKAITNGRRLIKVADGFSLVDAYGAETIRFVNYKREYQNDYNYFGGKYKLQLPNGGIRLRVSDGAFTLQGCNTFTFTFTLTDSGIMVFGTPSATTATCQVDLDQVFLYTLLRTQNIAVVDKNIIFFNGNNIQIAKAINYDENSKGSNVVVIDNKSPVVPTTQFFIPDGTYKFTLLRTSLKVLTVTVTKGQISWRGCNIFNMKYTAASDGTIKFSLGISTKIACKQDYDNFYSDALLSVTKFNEMKGMYTFFDDNGKSVVSFVSDFGTGNDSTKPPVLPPVITPPVVIPPVVVPPVVIPPVDVPPFKDIIEAIISLKGKYFFQLPKLGFEIINQDFVFKGCNTHRIPCVYKNANIFFGNPISTSNNKCDNNIDSFFLGIIPQISTFKKENNIFSFFSSFTKQLFSANLDNKKKSEVAPGLSTGSYQASLPNVDVEFDDNNFVFNECNKNSFGYKAKNTGSILFNGSNQSCGIKNYEVFSNAVKNSFKYRNIDGGFILEDKNGNEQGRCLRK